jgi:uncharacterized protein YcbK (DUF882 family)
MNRPSSQRRRTLLLRVSFAATGAAIVAPTVARAARLPPRSATDVCAVRLVHLHTREELELPLLPAPFQRPGLLATINRFLRDHYSGAQGRMDPGLLDQLRSLQLSLAPGSGTIEVISGFRSAETNERLRRRGGGGVASRSLHLEGRALDLRVPGVPLAALRDAALELRAGGVGFYPASDFVHIDTGGVRRWG